MPTQFYEKIDSSCAAFLWKNKTDSARGSRVAWRDICRPKCEGGLRIRLLEDFENVFRLKHISNLFTNAGSLWVAWVNKHVFGRKGFWRTDDAALFSRSIRSMLQIKHLLIDFMCCEIRNGQRASFWYDHWTEFGPLITLLGSTGPRQLRLPMGATVIQAVREGNWNLPNARSDGARELQILLTSIPPPTEMCGPDIFLWVNTSGNFVPSFSSRATWDLIRERTSIVTWNGVVWFKEEIPRCSFISWLVLKKRLPTRDRLRRWGLSIPLDYVLCSTGIGPTTISSLNANSLPKY